MKTVTDLAIDVYDANNRLIQALGLLSEQNEAEYELVKYLYEEAQEKINEFLKTRDDAIKVDMN